MMLTRCPACTTAFRVTPEQLKARKGHVRCGRCQHVFNAVECLVEEPQVAEPSPVVTPTTTPPTIESVTAPVSPDTAPTLLNFPSTATANAAPAPAQSPPAVEIAEPATALANPAEEAAPPPVAENIPGADITPPQPEPKPTVADASVHEAPTLLNIELPKKVAAAEIALADEPAELIPPPSPLQEKQSETGNASISSAYLKATEASRTRRWPWLIGIVIALSALLVQGAITYRVSLAANYPDARPALESLCEAFACKVGLPSDPALLSIEASDLHPADAPNKGKLELTATLKNRAGYAQQWPHLELTLTDIADKELSRRVVTPAEYLPAATNKEAGFAANADQAVKLLINANDLSASGYRLYLFYP